LKYDQPEEQSMSDPNYDRGEQDFTSSGPFWAAMAILALFLFGVFLYLAPGTDNTAMNAPASTGQGSATPGSGEPAKPATRSTTGSGTPSR
jgi:hypothetical protein